MSNSELPWADDRGVDDDPAPTAQHRLLELAGKIVVPIGLAVIATRQDEDTRFWALLGFAGLFALWPAALWAQKRISASVARRSDDRLARRELAQFRALVVRFAELLDPSRNDTFESVILSEYCRRSQTKFEELGLVRANLFNTLCQELLRRTDEGSPDAENLCKRFDEFTTLVNEYVKHCMDPILGNPTDDFRESLNSSVRSELEAVRERFVSLRDDLEGFGKMLRGELKTHRIRQIYFPRPRPL